MSETALKAGKKVMVKPIRRPGGWLKDSHDGAFMYTGTAVTLQVPSDATTGELVDPLEDLTDAQKEDLAKRLSMSADDFNIYRAEKNFWKGYVTPNKEWKKPFEVKLSKEVKYLDLGKPMDFLAYKVLLANRNLVAPSPEKQFDNGTYRFVLIDEAEETTKRGESVNKKKEAYRKLDELEQSEKKMRDFFKVYGLRVPKDATKDWMITELDKLIENSIDKFLEISTDVNYDEKILIADAIEARALVLKGRDLYATFEGTEIGNLEQTISYLKNPKNSKLRMTIEAQIKNSK